MHNRSPEKGVIAGEAKNNLNCTKKGPQLLMSIRPSYAVFDENPESTGFVPVLKTK
jgi:hypothetical protein